MKKLVKFGRRPQQEHLLGFDLSAGRIKVVHLTADPGGALRLENYATEELPDGMLDVEPSNIEALGAHVAALWRSLRTDGRRVAIALPDSMVFSHQMYAPDGLSEDDLETRVRAELQDVVSFAAEDMNIDFARGDILENGEQSIYAVAAKRAAIEDRVAVFETAGLEVVVVDSQQGARHRALKHVLFGASEPGVLDKTVLVDVGERRTVGYVYRNGEVVARRESGFGGGHLLGLIASAYGCTRDKAIGILQGRGVPDDIGKVVLRPYVEQLAQNMIGMRNDLRGNHSVGEVRRFLISGGGAGIDDIDSHLAERIGIEVRLLNPFVHMSIASRIGNAALAAAAPALLCAAGLAMRRTGA